ncbi:MAG: LLM class flavin-dependent oxidoreductase [Hyphomicrobiaceae bacterium]|nr:LLM class flavin-dependent oxidoreductase [Hyphomicrobiaceae bacterium]
MPLELGYLLPTREMIMSGRNETSGMLELAERAEKLGFDGIWIGDSLTARPRHEPLAMLAAVAARVPRVTVGTAVLLPALRNPVLLAHQAATIDRISEGRLVLGVGIARDVPSIRAEFDAAGVPFEKRVGRMMEGLSLARALWSGEPVDWDGRWTLKGATVGPTPHRKGGPLLWAAGALPPSLERTGKFFDGWMPNEGNPEAWARGWREVCRIASEAGRDTGKLTGSMYLTLSLDDDVAAANARLDRYLESYYGAPAVALRKRQECFAGAPSAVAEYLAGYARAGAHHLVLRFVGDHVRAMEQVSKARAAIGR